MARALVVALWCATASAASASRYGDYSVARMPQYGGAEYDQRDGRVHEAEDYRGHAHDAPAALDYKYEEELAGALAGANHGKTDPPLGKEEKKEVEETDTWHRPHKKHKKTSRTAVDHMADSLDKFDPDDDFPKKKSSSRAKHMPRHNRGKYENSDDEAHRYPINHNQDRNDDDFVENEDLGVKDEFPNDKGSKFDDKNIYGHRDRRARRKPRDKYVKRRSDRDPIDSQSDVEKWMLAREGMGRAPEPLSDLEDEEVNQRRRPTMPLQEPPEMPLEDEEPMGGRRGKGKKQKDLDYSDYYDMKRVKTIKNKLPSLMMRPTTVREEITMTTASRSLHEAFANRRVFLPSQHASRSTIELVSTDASTTSTSSKTSISTTAAEVTTVLRNATSNSSELSLAEKSRLSILKKALRKESLKGPPTTKPPVLLLVTRKLPTIVMVEPPSSEPFLRAREVYADSPGRLEKVKRLMRHKLVANAKNIHDLTDNWDDLVCDYIDMSLLDNIASSACKLSVSSSILVIFTLKCVCPGSIVMFS